MDIHRGDVLALASTPGFDPNAFNRGLTPRDWDRLLSNRRSPMINKAVSGWYAPGSTFKPVVCLAALENRGRDRGREGGLPGLDEPWSRPVSLLARRRARSGQHGGGAGAELRRLFYELARRLGIRPIADMARRFGFGDTLGIELPGERSGLVPDEEWKEAKYGVEWQKGETVIAGIGQGFLLATPLQIVTMMARLANGGRAVVPRLVLDEQARSPSFGRIGIPKADLEVVMRGLRRAVNGPRATAASIRNRQLGFAIAGKTGSVQVRRISREERRTGKLRNEDLPREQRDHALFVGVAPADRPVYAACVVVEHGGSGGAVAAPIAAEILARAIRSNFTSSSPRVIPLPPALAGQGRNDMTGPDAGEFGTESPGVPQKLATLNWGLIALVVLIASIGCATLYSAGQGSWDRWALQQAFRFAVGLALAVGIALVDIRVLLNSAYPVYAVTLLLVVAVEFVGEVGKGAQRWIDLGVVQLPAFGTHEGGDRPGAGTALSRHDPGADRQGRAPAAAAGAGSGPGRPDLPSA